MTMKITRKRRARLGQLIQSAKSIVAVPERKSQTYRPVLECRLARRQAESQDQDEFEVTPGVESRADLLFKDQDGGKAILIDVTSASGLSRYVKLHRYFPGAVAELGEQRKTKAYSRL
jgi:hypothetical protein